MKKFLFLFVFISPLLLNAQITVTQTPTGVPLPVASTNAQKATAAWYRGGNIPNPSVNNIFGTFWNSEVHHYTNGTRKFTTSVNAGLTNNSFGAVGGTVNGDGISIANHLLSSNFATIDLFTGPSNATYFRMGQAFLIQTSSNRVEQYANFQGFWYNATGLSTSGTAGIPQYIWNIVGVEKGRLGSNGWWKLGNNPTTTNAGNIVEISTTNAVGNPYGVLGSGLRFRNLTSASTIIPNGTNGVNSSKVLTVDGNGDVVLTNPIGVSTLANNGLQVSGGFVQLGGNCSIAAEVAAASLLSNRKILLKNQNLLFEQTSPPASLSPGRIGIGDMPNCATPGNLVHIVKNNSGPGNVFGLSGLRLGDLRTGATVNPPNGKVLSVDNNGDVILVAAPSSTGVTLCASAPVNNVVKVTASGTAICGTNITDIAAGNFVGINNTAPNDALDVSPTAGSTGNIDVNNSASRYEINDDPVLWHKGNVNDIFVGVGAALNATGSINNTIMGHNASSVNAIIGHNHTMLGAEAGMNHNGGGFYTFVGARAGANHPGIFYSNTFIGAYSGENETGAENVYVGYLAGQNPTAGLSFHNVFVGDASGGNNANGSSNAFLGFHTGLNNINGSQNTLVGESADVANPNLTNAAAIGSSAIVVNKDQMILGNNNVNVGIGLSGDAVGPQDKLEIDAGINGTNPSLAGPGASGLRFRDLKSNAATVPNPGPGVLAVDVTGEVIYVPSSAGGGLTLCGTAPVNNVVKVSAVGTAICGTNITDLNPVPFVGINNTAPNDALDVNGTAGTSGDIDVNISTSRYEIADDPILWHKGNTSDLFVGVGAGNLITAGPPTGMQNTVVGANAHSTGLSMGQSSVFVGYGSGQNTSFHNNSTMVGCEAGANNLPGMDEATFVGWRAGFNNQGLHNTFVGSGSGYNNIGYQNTFVGIGSGFNGGGQYNVSIGGGSGPFSNTISNSVSVGNGVNARNSNQMLLGDNVMHVGIGLNTDIAGPATPLEIDGGLLGTAAGGNGNAGASGLRFRDLTSLSIPQLNPGLGLLALNSFGDVIYVNAPAGGGSGVGNYCGTVPNPLTTHYQVPLNNNNYYFTDDATMVDKVGIGYNCNNPMPGKLSVITAFPTNTTPISYTIHGVNNNTTILSTNAGVYGEANSPGLSTDAIGVWGKAINSSRRNIGVYGEGGSNLAGIAMGGLFESRSNVNNINIGLHAEVDNALSANIGVEAIATGGLYARGGVFDAVAFSTNLENIGVTGRGFPFSSSSTPSYPFSVNIGVYGQVPFVLPPTLSGDYAGFFDGNVWVNGPSSGIGYLVTSDARFKKNIKTISNGMEIIKKLNPTTYNFDTQNKYGMRFNDKNQYGFIAQEVEKVLPDLVQETNKPAMLDKEGKKVTEGINFKAVNYDGFIPILVKGVQEQQSNLDNIAKELDEQKKINKDLQTRLEQLEKLILANSTSKQQETTVTDPIDAIVLNQNVPNPFSEKTTISYSIPAQTKSAYIFFYSIDGKLLQKTILTQKGKGEITVYAANLSSGNYTYSLIVDGKTMESKRMTVR